MSCKWKSLFLSAALAATVAGVAVANVMHPPLPEPLRESAPQLRPLGQGTLTWFGLTIYDSTLWVAGSRWSMDQPFALDIRYQREIAGSRIVRSSVDEIRRIGWRDGDRLARWEREMARVFPDVKAGDRLVGVNVPGLGARFYGNNGFIGEIADPEFAQAFFGIWLSPGTREPDLRAALLGGT
ncbi:MAG TPA: chalcone isomerase family protein [Pelomicrobium sp.]|nr:chalcone isomerase family protein [Pelomicrobium sp.]